MLWAFLVLVTAELCFLGQFKSQSVNHCQLFENILYTHHFIRVIGRHHNGLALSTRSLELEGNSYEENGLSAD